MSEVIYYGVETDLNALISRVDWSADTLMILEKVPAEWLDEEKRADGIRFKPFNAGERFTEWQVGWVFNARGELRWRAMENGRFQVVYIGTDIGLSGLKSMEVNWESSEPVAYFLWGEKVTSDTLSLLEQKATNLFLELQVPRLLRYPISSNRDKRFRLKLNVVEYRDKNTKQIRLYRFHSVEEEP